MALPVDYFQPESFQQANPMLSGIGAAQNLYQQAVQNRYLAPMLAQQLQKAQLTNQIMQPQAQYAPQMTQAELAYRQAQTPYIQAQTKDILQGQLPMQLAEASKDYAMIPLLGAQAGLTGTQTAMNRFKLNNPALMLGGMAGNIGGYALLQQMYPQLFGDPKVSAPSADQAAANSLGSGLPTSVPGMPSMGTVTAAPPSNAPILPPNAYGNSSNAAAMLTPLINPQASAMPVASPASAVTQPQGAGGLPNVQDMARMLFQQQFAPLQKDVAQTGYYNMRTGLAQFQALPKDTQNQLIAQGRGLGMTPTQTLGFISQGGDLNQLTRQVEQRTGEPVTPQYAPEAGALQKAQISTAAASALTDINPILTNALAPYSRQFLGHSPRLVVQEITGQSPDSQAQALAARALSPEIASLRLKAMNAQSGIEAIREVQETSMLGLKNFQGMVSPQVFKLANQYLDSWVSRMTNSYNNALINNTGQINQIPAPNQSMTSNVGSIGAPMRTINGVTYRKIGNKWGRVS